MKKAEFVIIYTLKKAYYNILAGKIYSRPSFCQSLQRRVDVKQFFYFLLLILVSVFMNDLMLIDRLSVICQTFLYFNETKKVNVSFVVNLSSFSVSIRFDLIYVFFWYLKITPNNISLWFEPSSDVISNLYVCSPISFKPLIK